MCITTFLVMEFKDECGKIPFLLGDLIFIKYKYVCIKVINRNVS